MLRLAFLLLPLALAGCAGQIRDYVGPRASIVSPQLLRYGFDLQQSRCLADYLGETLRPKHLRLFVRAAGALHEGWYDPGRLTPQDLAYLAAHDRNQEVGLAFTRGISTCQVTLAAAARRAPAPAGAAPGAATTTTTTTLADGRSVTILGPGQLPPPSGAPSTGEAAGGPPVAAAPVTRPATWLNLGAAGSGQSIAIDASTIEQTGNQRSAWFRLTDPGQHGPSADTFLLHIDCGRRTINARSRRRHDAAGAVADTRDYPDNPLTVEGGTVMEIAWLSLCT